jgi:1-acylglycerone phosphate reductase
MPLADVHQTNVHKVFQVNVFGVVSLTNHILPLLVASRGLIVNISSSADRLPYAFQGTYAMTKAALTSYSRTLSVELAPFDVRVLNVVAGFLSTQLGKRTPAEPWPEGTWYEPLRALVRPGAGTEEDDGATNAGVFADAVVREAVRGKGWEVGPWRFAGTRETMFVGKMSWVLRVVSWLGDGWGRMVALSMFPFWKLGEATGKKQV